MQADKPSEKIKKMQADKPSERQFYSVELKILSEIINSLF